MAVGERSRQSLRLEPEGSLTHERKNRLIESDTDRRQAQIIGGRLRTFKSRKQIQKREIPDFGIRNGSLPF